MKKEKVKKLPKSFFSQPRPTISLKEALKDVTPFEWSENALNGKSKVKIVSAKRKTNK